MLKTHLADTIERLRLCVFVRASCALFAVDAFVDAEHSGRILDCVTSRAGPPPTDGRSLGLSWKLYTNF